MKKLLVSLFFIICFIAVYAQSKAKDHFDFYHGPRLGSSASRLVTKTNDPDISNLKNRNLIGLQIGYMTRLHYYNVFFEPEINFSVKGGKIEYTVFMPDPLTMQYANFDIQEKHKIYTLDIPLLIGYNIGSDDFNLRPCVGGMVTYNFSEKNKISPAETILADKDIKNLKDTFWSVVAGISMDLWGVGVIDIRYERSLNNISWNKNYKQTLSNISYSIALRL